LPAAAATAVTDPPEPLVTMAPLAAAPSSRGIIFVIRL
jgi:hypothetical protein